MHSVALLSKVPDSRYEEMGQTKLEVILGDDRPVLFKMVSAIEKQSQRIGPDERRL
jgi:hypothetical protein